jgi:cytochrome c peroxidase
MSKTISSPILQMIRQVVEDQSVRQLRDQHLLQMFTVKRDEGAFGTILRRHGPMVLDVCRAVLHNDADAEDAFQATFLILSRKAESIRKSASLGSWLHGVAYRTALKVRSGRAIRQKKEAGVPAKAASGSDELTWREVRQVVHEELSALAERHRVPLVACYLEGKTQDEAAAQLGLAKSTLKERLERGRSVLRARLLRRGLGPAVLVVAASWVSAAPVPLALFSSTLRAVCLSPGGHGIGAVAISPKVVSLVNGVLKAMVFNKLKYPLLLITAVTVVGMGSGLFMLAGIGARGPSALGADDKAPDKPSTERTLHLPATPDHYAEIDLPDPFKTQLAKSFDNTPRDNPVTDDGATLGRVLFYDTRLSANNSISCSSCHVQKNGFADPDRFSKGFDGKLTDRHAMSLSDLRFNRRGQSFWDERSASLEAAVLVPIQSKIEMGQDLGRLMELLAKDECYPELYKKAFGDTKITQERTAMALAQFLRSMVSYQSKFDEGLAKVPSARDDFRNFTVQENRGKALFLSNCASCHQPGQGAHFSMLLPSNNGLDEDFKRADGGVGAITLNSREIGLFKSPSLRNVERTGPYMHDGRFDTLEKVIDHYSKEVKPHPNLNPLLRSLNFTNSEKAALVAFLKTLTDEKFLTDPKFSDPFQK